MNQIGRVNIGSASPVWIAKRVRRPGQARRAWRTLHLTTVLAVFTLALPAAAQTYEVTSYTVDSWGPR